MATTEDTSSEKSSSETPGVEEIQADIEKTRAELGETIEALEAKLDVKTRARNKAAQVKEQAATGIGDVQAYAGDLTSRAKILATDDQGGPAQAVLIGAVAALTLLGALVVWRQRR